MKVVFMGTPEFAVAALDSIRTHGHEVVGVVTTPDKPAGRGQHLRFSAVKTYAMEHGLFLMQPDKLKDETFVRQLQQLEADVFVVVAFRMLPKQVYAIPPKGTFNVHASLLPQYRGAAPIQWAIMNGETESGVTTFLLDEHTDTGAVLARKTVPVTMDDTAGTLHDKLMLAGASLAVETLQLLSSDNVKTFPQCNVGELKPAPKVFRKDMHIDWNDTAEHIYNKVRGLSPYPASFSYIKCIENGEEHDLNLKILSCRMTGRKSLGKPGIITILDNEMMLVSTKDDDIVITELQLEGKKRLETAKFLAGFRKENFILELF